MQYCPVLEAGVNTTAYIIIVKKGSSPAKNNLMMMSMSPIASIRVRKLW